MKTLRESLIRSLLEERPEYENVAIPSDDKGQERLLRALMNVRMPKSISATFIKAQDMYLKAAIAQKGITTLEDLTPAQPDGQLFLWQGDITTLKVDAIVNAANSAMLGCFAPNHGCIDNAIHTYAGIQLRLACEQLMEGREEPTGQAQITPAFNLPCGYVIHTVGPIVSGTLTQKDCDLLASCYRACLELAVQHDLHSIAFCCISTGEFHFPGEAAAQIAIATVTQFLADTQSDINVIFNVFKDNDYEIYKRLLI